MAKHTSRGNFHVGKKLCRMALAKSGIIKRFRRMSGSVLRAIRKPKMTLEKLSEVTGISQSQLSRFETDQRKPRVAEAVAIAKALNVSVSEIFPSLAAEAPTDTDIAALLDSVLRSYDMLGLDEDAARELLKLVLARAAAQKAPGAEGGPNHRQPASKAQKFEIPKSLQDDKS